MKKMTTLAHHLLSEAITPESTVIDATMGNGYDTVFLAKISKKVYAFDIQKTALKNTKSRLEKKRLNNVELILDTHANVQTYVKEKIDAAIFNLGYLPGSDKTIITTGETTIQSINQILPILSNHGTIVIVIYTGHVGGLEEATNIENYTSDLDIDKYLVSKYQIINANTAPYIIQISKA